jgi:site-specific DNA recombinase
MSETSNGIIYTRVSSKEQVDGHTSLQMQEKECMAYAAKNNVDIIEERIFREEGESAKAIKRTVLQQMLNYVGKHRKQIDVLYIWKIDRLARNLGDYYAIKVALSQHGIRVESVTEPIDDDPVGRFLEAILAAAAQFDNEIRAIRTTSGMRATVEGGRWPHQAPIGYTKKEKKIVIDPKFGPIIRDILTTYSNGGHNLTSIAQYAYDRGVKTKSDKPKTTDAMKLLLMNPIYAGFVRSKLSQKITKGLHKALVPEEIITKNRDLILGNKKNYVAQGNDLFPLKNILRCSNCKGRVTASRPKGNGGRYPLYHCNAKTCRKHITGKRNSISVDKAHEDFRRVLGALKPLDEGIKKLFKDLVLAEWNRQYATTLETIESLNRSIEEDKRLKQATTEKYIAGKISDEEKEMTQLNLDKRIAAHEEDLTEMDEYSKANEEVIDKAMLFISDPALFWNRASTGVKQMVQLLLFPKGVIYDFETGFGTIKEIESYLLIKEIAQKGDSNHIVVAATGIEPVTLGL